MDFELLTRLSKDKKQAAALLSREEGIYLVNLYYDLQNYRLASEGRIRSMEKEPNEILKWASRNFLMLERDLKGALGYWAAQYNVGQWMQSICGVGPVISAGLLAHLDIRKAKTAGHFWSFAGITGHQKWEKGQKRPWNGDLKTLVTYKLGECFVKVQNRDADFYGKLFAERKKSEIEANDEYKFKEQAEEKLRNFNIGKSTEAYKFYKNGQLPPAHIHARARRWTVKVFLSHLHEVMYWDYFKKEPPVPYVFSEHCAEDHKHRIAVPNFNPTEKGNGKTLRNLLVPKEKEKGYIIRKV